MSTKKSKKIVTNNASDVRKICTQIGDKHAEMFEQSPDLKTAQGAIRSYSAAISVIKAQLIYKKMTGNPGKIDFLNNKLKTMKYLTHVTLYAKGHYKRSDNIWEDLKKILVGDGYGPYTNSDVYIIIAGMFMRHIRTATDYRLEEFFDNLDPKNCWRIGYYHDRDSWAYNKDGWKVNVTEYDYKECFVRNVLSTLSILDVHQLGWDINNTPEADPKLLPLKNS